MAAESPAVEEPSPAAEAEFPAAEDATEDEEKPVPAAFTGSVTAELQNKGEIFEGDTLVFLAKVTGDASLVTIRWQAETEENVWKDLASGERFVGLSNIGYRFEEQEGQGRGWRFFRLYGCRKNTTRP